MTNQPTQDDAVSPPWGWFPVEQFLIRLWDATSPLDPDEQRRALLASFMGTDELPDEWTAPDGDVFRVPTPEEVGNILAPWRPLKARNIAYQYLHRIDNYVILRTYYGPGSDAKMAAILEEEEDYDMAFVPDDQWWRVLDDAELFNFGEDWENVFHVLPELVGHQERRVRRGLTEAELALDCQMFGDLDQDTTDQVSPIIDQI